MFKSIVVGTDGSETADIALRAREQGQRGARRVLGSVPNKVSHRAPCDVLIVQTA